MRSISRSFDRFGNNLYWGAEKGAEPLGCMRNRLRVNSVRLTRFFPISRTGYSESGPMEMR